MIHIATGMCGYQSQDLRGDDTQNGPEQVRLIRDFNTLVTSFDKEQKKPYLVYIESIGPANNVF